MRISGDLQPESKLSLSATVPAWRTDEDLTGRKSMDPLVGKWIQHQSPVESYESCSVAHEAQNAHIPGYKITQIFLIVRICPAMCPKTK